MLTKSDLLDGLKSKAAALGLSVDEKGGNRLAGKVKAIRAKWLLGARTVTYRMSCRLDEADHTVHFREAVSEFNWGMPPPTFSAEWTTIKFWERSGKRTDRSVGGGGTIDYGRVREELEQTVSVAGWQFHFEGGRTAVSAHVWEPCCWGFDFRRVRPGLQKLPVHRISAYAALRFSAQPVETMVAAAILVAALVLGLATAGDFGFTIDEFNADDYGPKALAWYTSGFTDRSQFETVEQWLWTYGPWFQILTAIVQSFKLADPITVRHAMTFLVGLAGIAALLPIARATIGGSAGVAAIILCLTTGYLYGHLFFTPIDVPFLAAMTLATLTIVVMAARQVPPWPATIATGLATGLAIATRTSGIITQAYLIGAMLLSASEVVLTQGRAGRTVLLKIALRTSVAIVVAWIVAILLWPWLQIGNPVTQFAIAYRHFWTIENVFSFPSWGQLVTTNTLPWHYVPGQLLARLPEGFLLLLAAAFVIGTMAVAKFARKSFMRWSAQGNAGLKEPLLMLARARGTAVIVAAALVPPTLVIVSGSTLYDGVRHLLFIIPMLALLAGGALTRLVLILRGFPTVALIVTLAAIAHIGFTLRTLAILHPLEYVATNALAGGTQGSYGRFELDYWGAAATDAVRRLEQRLDQDVSWRDATHPPRVLICIPWREARASLLFRRNWVVETDERKADFLIGTERWNCGEGKDVMLIDRVERFGQPFAWTFANADVRTTP
jgi:hypothetical protein